ncbi:hypothetical protein HYW68_01275 [Candidatus Parcubacteria bacterium]|nr:hypothetical protein [Candidatus Parcubacteria bacterium]
MSLPIGSKRKQAEKSRNRPKGTSDARILERSDTVLWTIAPPGIVLHNFACRRFLELNAVGYKAWAFLDGARTVDEVVARCSTGDGSSDQGRRASQRKVRHIVDTLAAYGFVVERSDG